MCPRVDTCLQSNVFSENFHRINPLLDFRIGLGSMGSKSTYKHRSDIGLRKKKKKKTSWFSHICHDGKDALVLEVGGMWTELV